MAAKTRTSETRPLSEKDLRDKFGYMPGEITTLRLKLQNLLKCNITCLRSRLRSFVPILTWLPKYIFMEYALGDFISGITTAIVRIPQGLAYGLLAGLLPINGLYTEFFSPLVYSVFGSSRHISAGVTTIISLMLGNTLARIEINPNIFLAVNISTVDFSQNGTERPNNNIIANSSYSLEGSSIEYTEAQRLTVISSLTVLVGLILLLLGFCRLGFVAMFLSEPVVSGFTTAVAIHVITSQLKHLTGIPLQIKSGYFEIILIYIELFSRLSEIKWPTIITSVICLIILVPIKFVNRQYKKKLKNIPIPVELLIVILGTGISYSANLNKTYSIKIVGSVPSGMPSPILPNTSLWPVLIGDAISIALVSFALAVSIGKIFALKHGYSTDPNQEFIALGLCQIVSGFFRGHCGGCALSRSAVQESAGGNTQIASLVSCSIMLLVILVIGPAFENLPVACLACMILANMHNLLKQVETLPRLWRVDKYDFSTWLLTFLFVSLLKVDTGLLLGVIFSLCCGGIRQRHVTNKILGKLNGIDVYRDVNLYQDAHEIPGIKIIQFSQSPTYANKSSLEKIISLFHYDRMAKLTISKSSDIENIEVGNHSANTTTKKTYYIIFDCSCWSMIDTVGMSSLHQVITELTVAKNTVFLASIQGDVYDKLSLYGIVDGEKSAVKVYPTVSLAVATAKDLLESECQMCDAGYSHA